MDPTKVYSVDLLKCDVWQFPDKTSLKVEAIGCASSGGWTNPVLVPVDDPNSPDGYYTLEFRATPPDQPSTQVETPIKATYEQMEIPSDLVGIKVVAETNYKQKNVFQGEEQGGQSPTWGGQDHSHEHDHDHDHDHDHGHGGWRKRPKPWEDSTHNPGWDPPGKPCGCGEGCENGEVECLVGIDVWDKWITIYVYSNGHTKKEHFKWCLFKGCSNHQPYLLEFCRCVPDNTPCEEPQVIPIKFTCHELCLEPGDKFVVRNPLCCKAK